MKNYLLLTALAAACTAALYTGCTSNIKPLEPIRRVVMWVPDNPASQPSAVPTTSVAEGVPIPQYAPVLANTDTFPATRPAETESASTEPAETQTAASEPASTESASTRPVFFPDHPGEHLVVRVIDPNQTTRYIYHATYDNIWQQAMKLLTDCGFTLDRKDYRLGILTTQPLPSAQFVEPWKPQQTTFKNAMENTINMQQRRVRVTISKVPEKPDFYEIGIQVLVERQNNPIETIGGPVFVEGSGFGRSQVSLRSDYAPPETKNIGPLWYTIGHDPQLEHKLLSELFKHI
jgi:hypothetical protein